MKLNKFLSALLLIIFVLTVSFLALEFINIEKGNVMGRSLTY